MPIKKKSEIHTGPKTQFGGLKEGLINEAYHPGIDGDVKNEPIMPASWHATIEAASLAILGLVNFISVKLLQEVINFSFFIPKKASFK
jgi:hypothetical protein